VPSAPSMPAASCTHDLGRGTTVCLRCRQERRDAARTRQQRLFAISGVAAMALLGVYVMGASAANAWRATARGDTSRVATRASVVASSVNGGGEVKQQGDAPVALTAAPDVAGALAPAPLPAAAPLAAAAAPAPPGAATAASSTAAPTVGAAVSVMQPPIALSVPEGRTDLTESLVAERGGDSVVVDFDTPATRTRRRDKFEAVVRRTLPMVFGAPMDSVLRAIPDGGIAGGADLLDELPKRGVHLRVAQGWMLDLWPETRPGQDGPLVVSYRARVIRDRAR
jgi:hypothetical protein